MKIKNLIFYTFINEFDNLIRGIREKNKDHPDVNKKITENYGQIVDMFDNTIIDFFIARFSKKNYLSFLRKHISNEKTISKNHSDSFRFYFAYIETVHSIYDNLKKNLSSESQIRQTDSVVISLYGYLIRLADQAGGMLLNGYPDGAIRIWRSFYECGIILMNIESVDDDDIAIKFIDHSHRNQDNKIESYQKRHNSLNFPSLDSDFLAQHQTNKKNLDEKYGRDFLGNDWAWAKDILKKDKVNFRDLESNVNMGKYRPYYIWACSYTHTSFDALFDFVKDKNIINLNDITQQNLDPKGLIDPMQLIISVFQEVNIHFVKRYSIDHEYDLNISFLLELRKKLMETFN